MRNLLALAADLLLGPRCPLCRIRVFPRDTAAHATEHPGWDHADV